MDNNGFDVICLLCPHGKMLLSISSLRRSFRHSFLIDTEKRQLRPLWAELSFVMPIMATSVARARCRSRF